MSRLERTIGAVLRAGVVFSTACLAAGLILTLAAPQSLAASLLNVGIIVLLATPVARVLVSVVDYAQQRDWTFTVLTLVVLIELAAGAMTALR
jgi:uncharacterized membrane protein